MKKIIGAIIILTIFIGLSTIEYGCRKKEPAPAMPPSYTMAFNNAAFSDTAGMSANKATHVNFFHSAINVGFWNLILTVTLAVPVASYAIALEQDADYDNHDKTWTWDYKFWGVHHAVLTAKIEQDTVIWRMKINEFEWYYGHSHTNGSGGYWMLNESAAQPTNLLRIDWALNSSGVSSIKYTNVAPSTSNHYKNNGEYILYGTVANAEYDRFYDVFMKDDNNPTISNTTNIAWNFADKHGHVKDPNKFGDTNWHCWDTSYADIVCQ